MPRPMTRHAAVRVVPGTAKEKRLGNDCRAPIAPPRVTRESRTYKQENVTTMCLRRGKQQRNGV